MNVIQTIKKCVLPSGSVLRMSFTIEGIYFIFLETTHYGIDMQKTIKDMLWNGADLREANTQYEMLKNNPLVD